MATSSKNTSLNSASPVIWRIGAHGDAGRAHVDDETGQAMVLAGVRVGPGDAEPELRHVRQRGPDLVAVEPPAIAVAHRAGAQRRQVGTGLGLAEQLAPDLLAGEQRPQHRLLRVGAEADQGRGDSADTDEVAQRLDCAPAARSRSATTSCRPAGARAHPGRPGNAPRPSPRRTALPRRPAGRSWRGGTPRAAHRFARMMSTSPRNRTPAQWSSSDSHCRLNGRRTAIIAIIDERLERSARRVRRERDHPILGAGAG